MLKNRFRRFILQIWIYRVSENEKIFRSKILVLEQLKDPDWFFLLKGDTLMMKEGLWLWTHGINVRFESNARAAVKN